MEKKVNFVWKTSGWLWEATHYNGHGIFYGKVTSPFVPNGEFGTWYYWEIKQIGAVLTKGNQQELNKLLNKKQTQKDMEWQQRVMEQPEQLQPHIGEGR